MESSRRCSICGTNWPPNAKYNQCPRCDIATWFAYSTPAISEQEAQEILHPFDATELSTAQEEFERYYTEREVVLLRAELDAYR